MKSIVWSVFLEKTARHIGLVVCLCIVFKASDKTNFSTGVILALAIGACALHLIGRSLKKEERTKRLP